MKRPLKLATVAALSAFLLAGGAPAPLASTASAKSHLGGLLWPMFGRNQGRTFNGPTSLTPASANWRKRPRWSATVPALTDTA